MSAYQEAAAPKRARGKGKGGTEVEINADGIAVGRLRSGIERIERLHEERKALGTDIAELFAEMKGAGFDVPAIKIVIKRRAMEPAEVEEIDHLVTLYCRALGE